MADDITGDLNEDRVSETNRENFEAPNIETAIGAAEPPLSKRDLKRLRKQEWFETQKKARRLKDKEKQKVRNVEYFKQTGQSIRKKREFLADALSRSVDINVVFDLSFADLMTSLDLGKLVKQIARCYSVNRSHATPLKIHLCSLSGQMLETMCKKSPGYQNWQLATQSADDYDQTFKKQIDEKKLVYLTAESDETVDELELGSYYVIGGLVDHNSRKGHCHDLATSKGIRTARLPIGKFLKMKSRHVLTVNHVFEILLEFYSCKDWSKALMSVIPQRKGANMDKPVVESEIEEISGEEKGEKGEKPAEL